MIRVFDGLRSLEPKRRRYVWAGGVALVNIGSKDPFATDEEATRTLSDMVRALVDKFGEDGEWFVEKLGGEAAKRHR